MAAVLLGGLLLFFTSTPVFAAARTWSGATNTDWNTAGNWLPTIVPTSADDVTIPAGLVTYPAVNSAAANAKTIMLATGAGAQPTLTVSGNTLTVAGNFTINAGTVTHSGGTISVTAGAVSITGTVNESAGTFLCSVGLTVNLGGNLNVSGTGVIHMASALATTPTDHITIAAGGTMTQSGGSVDVRDFSTVGGATDGTYTQSGGTFKEYHDFKNQGLFNSTGGIFEVAGTGGGGNWPAATGPTQFFDVLIDSGTDISLDKNNGTFTVKVAGNWTNNGTSNLTGNAPTIEFNGTAAQTIAGSNSSTFRNLTINNTTAGNTAAVAMNTSCAASLALTLTSDLTINSPAVLDTTGGTSAGSGDAIGNVTRTDFGATTRPFGNLNVRITRTAGTGTTFTVSLDKHSPTDFVNAVRRTYTLTPTGAPTATLRLRYKDSELNGNAEGSTLHLWRKTGTWSDQGQSSNNDDPSTVTDNNWVEKTGVTTFSPWTLSGSAPTAVRLTRFSAASFSDVVELSWESGYEVNNLGYHLYREDNGKRQRVTPSIVAGSALTVGPGSRLTAGYSYSWSDSKGKTDSLYYLEAIDLNGERQTFGPIYPSLVSASIPSPKQGRAMLLTELSASAESMVGSVRSAEHSWASALPASARSASLTLRADSLAMQQVIAAGQAVKIQVRHSGWYRLTQSELVAAGLNPLVNAFMLQLYADGQEVPIRLSSDGAHLNASDTVEFYGVALDTPTTDTHTYWLITGNTPGKRINARRSKAKLNDELFKETVGQRNFSYTTERKDKLIYFANLLNGDAENIFGDLIASDPVTQTITVRNSDRQGVWQPQLEIALQGATLVGHEVQVTLNGVNLGRISFNSREHPLAKFALDRTLLHDGDNTLSFVATSSAGDISLIDWVRLTYAHQYIADNNELQFSLPGGQTARVSGFTTPNVRVIDITDPNSVSEMAVVADPSGAEYAVKVQSKGSETRTLLAFDDDVAERAASVTANQPSSWNAAGNGADMIILTHKDFRQAIAPLAALRRSQGLKVAVVDIEDVYDEFSYGAHTPVALKAFLSWAASHWTRPPQYLLLTGDSSWDPRNYLAQGDNDFVPTKLIDTAYMETMSDDWLADFNGDDLPDMAVGRLPGRTAAQISLMVSKIISYEQDLDQGAPLRGALLVADKGFESANKQTRALLPSNMTVQMINRGDIGNDDITRGEIVDAINQGPLVVNYYGHGSANVWTGAGLLNSTLASSLTNANKLSLFVMMTCLNGYAHSPYIDSLGESVLEAQDGGAVAVWASSGVTEPQPQFVMDIEFYRQLFGPKALRLGLATRNAKAAAPDLDVRRTWILLGDPAMRLR